MTDSYIPSKRVIVEHQSQDPTVRRAKHKLQSEKHQDNWDTWMKVLQGGVIKCKSYGMAVNVRQSLYTTRKLVREADGQTAWDHLTIRLSYGNADLIVEKKDEGIIEIIPNPIVYDEDDAAPNKSGIAYVIPTPPEPYEGDGRPPIDIAQLFGDEEPKK